MNDSSPRVRAASLYARTTMRNGDVAHSYEHAAAVAKLAGRIGRSEGADLELVTLAAYLHDLVPRTGRRGIPHNMASAKTAEIYLRSTGLSPERSKTVRQIIEESSYEATLGGRKPSSLEAEVLRDADFLEAMGARGIARAFAFAGWFRTRSLGELDWDPRDPPRLRMSTVGPDPSPVWHFASKLLRLKGMMCTKTGKRLAEKRHAFMVIFLRRYGKEMDATQ